MISFILKIVFVQIAFLSSNNEHVQDQMLNRFISALDDENTIKNWKEANNITNIYCEKIFMRVIKNVRDIISVINNAKYDEFRLLVNNRFMDYTKIGYPFFETWVSSKSVKRIIELNIHQNDPWVSKYDMSKFDEEILYEEYFKIMKDIVSIMKFLDLKNFHKNLFGFGRNQFKSWINDNKDEDVSNSTTVDVFSFEEFEKNLDLSHDLIESILPVEYEKPVYVLAHFEGFENSRKCSGEGIEEFTRNESISVCSEEMLNVRPLKCKGAGFLGSYIIMENYMERPMLCDKVIAKRLIVFLHFYSQDRFMNTTYEVILTKDNEYKITWSFYDTEMDSPKEYWLEKEVEDLSNKDIIPKFGFIIEYGIEYSTVKSEDTEDEGVETRLILLDCGHQLGLDLIDEFFEHYYYPITRSGKCHVCSKDVEILGSYDTVVYKYKEE